MKLPNAEHAVIEPRKVRDYLLARDHPIGRAKARFFFALGFSETRWPELREALHAVARISEAEPGEANPFGQKYLVQGILHGPTGSAAAVVTVWIVLQGEDAPRFVTAYPGVDA